MAEEIAATDTLPVKRRMRKRKRMRMRRKEERVKKAAGRYRSRRRGMAEEIAAANTLPLIPFHRGKGEDEEEERGRSWVKEIRCLKHPHPDLPPSRGKGDKKMEAKNKEEDLLI